MLVGVSLVPAYRICIYSSTCSIMAAVRARGEASEKSGSPSPSDTQPYRCFEGPMESRRIKITAGDVTLHAALKDSETADLLWAVLPLRAHVTTWGGEIYFPTPIQAEEEDAQEVVGMGAIAYWPPGQALCLFFGPTPASRGDEIRPTSPVNVVASMEGDPTVLRQVSSGSTVLVERA